MLYKLQNTLGDDPIAHGGIIWAHQGTIHVPRSGHNASYQQNQNQNQNNVDEYSNDDLPLTDTPEMVDQIFPQQDYSMYIIGAALILTAILINKK